MHATIFLTNQYLPRPGATGVCVHEVARELAGGHEKTAVISYEDGNGVSSYDGVENLRVKIPFYLKTVTQKSALLKKAMHCGSVAAKLWHLPDYPMRSRGLVQHYKKAVRAYLKRNEIEDYTLIATFTPLEAVAAAAELKKEDPTHCKTVYYSTDTLSNEGGKGILSEKQRERMGKKWEQKLFSVYDRILIMECHRQHYTGKEYAPFVPKMIFANFPLVRKPENTESISEKEDKKLHFLYAGTMYRNVRNPKFLCDCLLRLSEKTEIQADFFGSGDCDDMLQDVEKHSRGSICCHGMAERKTVFEYLSRADVLLSIGNHHSPMAPSKIYEYMATGKPIIHLYSDEEDTCLEPLKKYGNALLIKQNDPDALTEIQEFLKTRKILPFEKVSEMFLTSTPAYTADLIRSL